MADASILLAAEHGNAVDEVEDDGAYSQRRRSVEWMSLPLAPEHVAANKLQTLEAGWPGFQLK